MDESPEEKAAPVGPTGLGPYQTPIRGYAPLTQEQLIKRMSDDISTIKTYMAIWMVLTVLGIIGAIWAVVTVGADDGSGNGYGY